jgi:2-methylcitrate dehydratase PrpD
MANHPWVYTERLAEFSSSYTYSHLPPRTIQITKDVILDTLGALFAAWPDRHPVSRIIGDFARNMGGSPECTILGRDFKAPAASAALVNGTMGYAADIEGGGAARMHAAACFVPTALVMGERQSISGKEFMAALALAYDIAGRVSDAASTPHAYPHSFHPTAVFTTFGAAAITGLCLKLNPASFVNAYGLAGSVAGGLIAWVDDPTEHSRSYGVGVAARNGVTAGLLAEMGFGGPGGIFDPMKYNIYDAFSGSFQPESLDRGLGSEFYIENQDGFKQYPCCGDIHTGLDALLAILSEQNIQADEIAEICHLVKETRRPVIDNNPLKSHNAQYILSIAAVDRQIRWDDFLRDRRLEPAIGSIYQKTRLVGTAELEISPSAAPAIVEVRTADGRVFSKRAEYRKGHSENPLSKAELEAKFLKLAEPTVGEAQGREIISLVRNMEEVDDIRRLIGLMNTKTS